MKTPDPDSIRSIRGIGEQKARSFSRMGILSCHDLISLYPRRYEDRSTVRTIASLAEGETALITAVVAEEPKLSRIRDGITLLKFPVFDGTGRCEITFFNQNYLKNQFRKGEEFSFYGKISVYASTRSMTNPVYEPSSSHAVTGAIVPVYPLSDGLTQKDVRNAVRAALERHASELPELLPSWIIRKERFPSAEEASWSIHFPSSPEALALARRKIVLEELFLLSLAMQYTKRSRLSQPGIRMSIPDLTPLTSSLPFSLTEAQNLAICDCCEDLSSGSCMSRLIQGDVGSGKTLVAAATMMVCASNGYLSAMMAPTEILATQHYETLSSLLSPLGYKVGLLCSRSPDKAEVKEKLKNGFFDIVVGTHALLSEDVVLPDLGLIITDEQHRFGVEQRATLARKGSGVHILVMSATPIPRTLALALYGELDLSIMRCRPSGRQDVKTYAVGESYRARLNAFIRKQVQSGHQVYVICPKVEDNGDDCAETQLKSAVQHCAELASALPELSIGCIHGRMKASEKEEVMRRFHSGDLDLLVSTTVVEVGVDVPNATLILIENAERFGLSQLHQLRGRVGRGNAESFCVLISPSPSKEARERLSVLCRTQDGFALAEEDLRLRGPGNFFADRQHGLPPLHLADLQADETAVENAGSYARELLESDPELNGYPVLRERLSSLYAFSPECLN